MGQPLSKQASTKKLRTVPVGEPAPAHMYKSASMVSVDNSKVDIIRQQIKSQLDELKATKCATPIKGDDNFLNYVWPDFLPTFLFHCMFSTFCRFFRRIRLCSMANIRPSILASTTNRRRIS